jgi:DNA-binding NtrC family response regulator
MRRGAADFVEKRAGLEALRARIQKALEQARAARRLRQLEAELAIVEPRRIVGKSETIRRVKELLAAVAKDGRITVLLTGETGTGKELVARAIHATGPRAEGEFIGVAVASLPSATLEAELFGYEPGAFTDARRRHLGILERAHRGVLFLDEIGELDREVQVKLLRFLEERTFTRLGGQQEIEVDVQVVAATNADLAALVGKGCFREDLFYRLKVCEIRLPALRERREDIPLLVEHFLRTLGGPRGVSEVSPGALEALVAYRWPGNVRELRNVVEAAALRAQLRGVRQIEEVDLPLEVREAISGYAATAARLESGVPLPLEEALARAELEQAEIALRRTGGRKSEAYKLLGLNDRFVFARRIKRLCQRFPELLNQFPAVKAAFQSERWKRAPQGLES